MIDELLASELRGRGGAFFPTGRKWSFVPKPDQNPNPHYLVVNADESEPGSCKDNEILARVPHRFIEGCLITAHAVEAKSVYVYIRGEYLDQYEILVAALEEIRDSRSSAATSRSSSTAAPAPTSAARRRRCSTRSRASAASRAPSRRSRPSPGSTPRRRSSTTSRRSPPSPPIIEHGRGRVREARRRELARHARSSRSPATSSAARQLRARAGRPRCAT